MTDSTNETPKSGGPLPMVAALLIVVLVGQVVFMFTKFKNAPPSTPLGAPVSTPRAVPGVASSRGPSPGQAGVATVPGGAGGSASPGAPGGPAVAITPYIGPPPSVDTSSWTFVPGDFLLGALLRVDGNAATRLKPEQAKQELELLNAVATPGKATQDAMDLVITLVPKVLDVEQMALMQSSPEVLRSTSLQADALIEKLKAVAGSTSAAPPQVTPDNGSPLAPMAVLALLDRLAETKKLKPEQAAKLLPAVTDALDKLKVQATYYPRLAGYLDKGQLAYMVGVLSDMRSGKLDPATVKVTLDQARAYFNARAAQ